MKQIIVTKKGQGIIPRALANGEVIKFTKVCISDKDYTGVELCNLESIENIKQAVKVDYVHIISNTQIEVVCSLDNENLENAYYIRTIGIYAEDNKGNEVLYGISVSDSVPKYMPKYEGRTLTGILYRLNININNAENVITDINNATVANVLEVQLIEKRVSGVEKRVSGVENRIVKIENDVTQFSNPNIFINSNFKASELVNQRGQTSYPNLSGYGIDMWSVLSVGNTKVQLDVESECIKISSLGIGENTFTDIRQWIENDEFYKGKEVTVTIDYEVSNSGVVSFFGSGFNSKIITGDGVRKKESFTFTYGGGKNNLFSIRLNRSSTNKIGDYIRIYSIKAELGSVSTPFVDDYIVTKLQKCQRYLCKVPFLEHMRAVQVVGNNLYFNTKTPVCMRTRPTIISATESIQYYVTKMPLEPVTGYSLGIADYTSNNLLLICTKQGNTVTDASLKVLQDIFLSAEF